MSKRAVPNKNKGVQQQQKSGSTHSAQEFAVGSILDSWLSRSMSPLPKVQAKLKIGEANDAFEREADLFAAKATEKPAITPVLPTVKANNKASELIQPKAEIPHQKEAQKKAKPTKVRPKLQYSGSGGTDAPSDLGDSLSSTNGQGFGLPAPLRSHYENLIGSDLSNVRLHTGLKAASMNQQIGARAFTFGQDIFFNAGQYNPNSQSGQSLIAHEVAHTVQQGNRMVVRRTPNGNASGNILNRGEINSLVHQKYNVVHGLAEVQRINRVPEAAASYRFAALLSEYLTDLFNQDAQYSLSLGELDQDFKELEAASLDEKLTSPQISDILKESPEFSHGFPEFWAKKIEYHLIYNNQRETRKVKREKDKAYSTLRSISEKLPSGLYQNGYPIPVGILKKLNFRSKFRVSMMDKKLPNASMIIDFFKADKIYQYNKKRLNYVSAWNDTAEKLRDVQKASNLHYLQPSNPISQVLSQQTLDYYIEYTQKLLPFFSQYNVNLRNHSAVTLEMLASIISNGLTRWNDPVMRGMQIFREAEEEANKKIKKDSDGTKLEKAIKWAWDYGYFDEAAKDLIEALKDNAAEIIIQTLAIIGGVAAAQFVPGLNVAVDVILILVGGFGAISTISKLVSAIGDVQDSKGVMELQRNAFGLSKEMTSGVVDLLISLALFLFGSVNKARRAKKANAGNFNDFIDDVYKNGTKEQRRQIDKARKNGNLGKAQRKAAAAEAKARKGFIAQPKSQFAKKRVETIDELMLASSAQSPVGHFIKDHGTALDVMQKLAANDQKAFDLLGVKMGGKRFESDRIEWGLAYDRKAKEYFVIKGNQPMLHVPGAVDWKLYIGKVEILAHSHPYLNANLTKRNLTLPPGKSSLDEVLKSSDNQLKLLPSAEDIKFMKDFKVKKHTVITPYRYNPKTKEIVNPDIGPHLPVVTIEIKGIKHLGKDDAFGLDTYGATFTFKADGVKINSKPVQAQMIDRPNGPLLTLTKQKIVKRSRRIKGQGNKVTELVKYDTRAGTRSQLQEIKIAAHKPGIALIEIAERAAAARGEKLLTSKVEYTVSPYQKGKRSSGAVALGKAQGLPNPKRARNPDLKGADQLENPTVLHVRATSHNGSMDVKNLFLGEGTVNMAHAFWERTALALARTGKEVKIVAKVVKTEDHLGIYFEYNIQINGKSLLKGWINPQKAIEVNVKSQSWFDKMARATKQLEESL